MGMEEAEQPLYLIITIFHLQVMSEVVCLLSQISNLPMLLLTLSVFLNLSEIR